MKVLHVAAEVHPLVKTGGLADVLAALPQALRAQGGVDGRLLLPGWPAVLSGVVRTQCVSNLGPCFGAARVTLLRAEMPDSGLPIYVIDAPLLYDRPGNLYHDEAGQEWPDNLQRFGLLGWVALQLAAGKLDPSWQPDLLHAHDWHAGMACAYLKSHACTVASVFTVHNLAYQGLFPHQDGPLLGLSARFMSSAGLEFHGQLSFMKAGLKFADRLTTVSPRYAQEITTPEFGCGLDGVLRSRVGALSGILNGIDPTVWDPTSDSAIAQPFSLVDLSGKAACKSALQTELGLPADPQAPLLLALSRLTAQKGLDLLLEALPGLLSQRVQVVVQGTGDAVLEAALVEAAATYPGRLAVLIGYDEKRAHRLMAGADLLVVPSRFEPCGLTQMYALRYGTLPVVRATGGLADTVMAESDARRTGLPANGFTFAEASAGALQDALAEAVSVWRDPPRRLALQRSGMAQDFSWTASALRYRSLYESLCPEAGRA